jgi:acylphosphatase/archaellum component FlaC
VRILVEGSKVQKVGYRIFLLERALWSGIENIYVKNLGSNKVEVFLRDLEEKVECFYEIVKSEKPEGAAVKSVSREPYLGKVVIPPIDRYFQFLTLEQLSVGREELVRLPSYVGKSVGVVASAISGIDEKFGDVVKRFGVFGESARSMDGKLSGLDEKLKGMDDKLSGLSSVDAKLGVVGSKLTSVDAKLGGLNEKLKGMDDKLTGLSGIDDKLKGIDEKLGKISTLPEKIDSLPERIAQALNSSKRKQA